MQVSQSRLSLPQHHTGCRDACTAQLSLSASRFPPLHRLFGRLFLPQPWAAIIRSRHAVRKRDLGRMGARRYSSPMLTLQQFVGFLVAAIVITASPGPDNLMVLGVGISKGRRQGIAFGVGCAVGCLSHTFLAAVGVSALIASSPVSFTVLKVCGGLYLLWLGFKALRSKGGVKAGAVTGEEQSSMRLFFR